jgi:transcriptional regulator with XRE-family HTH domain
MSVNTLAHRAGVSPGTLSRIESGETKAPSFDVVVRLAAAMGVDLHALAGRPDVAAHGLTPQDRERLHKLRQQLATALTEVTQLLES